MERTMSTHLDTGLGDLVLVRLLVSKDPSTTPSDLSKDLRPLVEHRWRGTACSAQIKQTLAELQQAGLVVPSARRWTLTEAGRKRAQDYLGADETPKPLEWKHVKSRWLIARALGIEHPSPEVLNRISKKEGLVPAILRREFGLPIDKAPTPGAATNALGWALLARGASAEVIARVTRRNKFPAGMVVAVLVYSRLGRAGTPDPKKAPGILAADVTGSKDSSLNALRAALLHELVSGTEPVQKMDAPAAVGQQVQPTIQVTEQAPVPLSTELPQDDLKSFSEQVLAAARRSPTGRYGDDRVFVSHAWRQFQREHPQTKLTEPDFKERLIEANRERHLSLVRADMAPILDPDDVASSEIRYLSATFHLICI
jgi:hypothetical protein